MRWTVVGCQKAQRRLLVADPLCIQPLRDLGYRHGFQPLPYLDNDGLPFWVALRGFRRSQDDASLSGVAILLVSGLSP